MGDDLKVGDAVTWNGKAAKVSEFKNVKIAIELDEDKSIHYVFPKSVMPMMKTPKKTTTATTSLTTPDVSEATSSTVTAPRTRNFARMGGATALGAVFGGSVLGPLGAAAGAALGAAYSEYSYRELQKEAKAQGLAANGSADDLRARLEAASAATVTAESPRTTDKTEGSSAATKKETKASKGKEKEELVDGTTPSGGNLMKKLDEAAAKEEEDAMIMMPSLLSELTTKQKNADPPEKTHAQEVKSGTLKVEKRTLTGPLFSSSTSSSDGEDESGPKPNEVHQGDVGNCYFCASLVLLSSYAPHAIKDAIVEKKARTDDGGRRFFEVRFRKNKATRAGKLPELDAFVTVTVDDTFYVGKRSGQEKEVLYMNTGLGGTGNKSLTGCIWPCVMEKAWAIFLAQESGISPPSFDLITAEEQNPLVAKCTVDHVCAVVAGWKYDSAGVANVTAINLKELYDHVAKGQPAALGTGKDTDVLEEFKMYGGHQYAVMGVAKDKDDQPCLRARNPHNKFKGAAPGSHGPPKLHRAKSSLKSQLYNDKVTTEFLLPLKDAEKVLSSSGCTIWSLTMPP